VRRANGLEAGLPVHASNESSTDTTPELGQGLNSFDAAPWSVEDRSGGAGLGLFCQPTQFTHHPAPTDCLDSGSTNTGAGSVAQGVIEFSGIPTC
jgi:hypothetical protein